MASANLINVTEANFAEEVTQSQVPVVVDFWAEWCGPCRMLTPILADLATEQEGNVKIVKVNVDEAPNLAAQFNVRSIPMLVFFKDGEAKAVEVGVQSKDAILRKVQSL